MPKSITKSKYHNLPIKPNSDFDIILNNFLVTGHFILTNDVVTTETLDYMMKYLARQPKPSAILDYKLCLDNLILDIETPESYWQNNPREYADDKLLYLLDEILKFSPKWSVIALDNVTILQEENYYPLSFNFMWHFGNLITDVKYNPVREEKKKELIVTQSLIITNAEFHSWVWRELLRKRTKLDSLTLEFLANNDLDENLAYLCDVLQYSDINILNLGNAEFTRQGYRTLNQFLKKEPFIHVQLREPIDSKSRVILKEHKSRITYLDHNKNFEAEGSLAKLDINQLMDDKTRTVGHWLLEKALVKNDTYMVKYLIKAGANLLEQHNEEPPFLLQIFEKNRNFKLIILNHIIHQRVLAFKIEHDLQNYSDLKDSIADMEASLRVYANILRQRTHGLISDYQKLLNLFKTMASFFRPSKQRDQEFIDIYWRLFKSIILFHDATGRVTIESISNTQAMLSKIIGISEKAELGLSHGSKLHKGLARKIDLLMKELDDIKELIAKANHEQYRLAESAKAPIDLERIHEPGPSARFSPRC